MTLKDDETSTLSKKNRDFKVKREWSDETYDDPPGKMKRIKLEQ
jgi:hypothetical protein